MSIRAKAAAAVASVGILVAGWNLGTAQGTTVATPSTTDLNSDHVSTVAPSASPSAGTTTGSATSPNSSTTTDSSPTSGATASGSASASSGRDGTYTGDPQSFRFGTITVSVTYTNGTITDVTADVQSDGSPHSEMIDQQAVPMLRSEVLRAQSASISTISGATFTSQAYLSSLQSALDKAS